MATTKKQLRSFIGVINCYEDMWQQRSEILTSLSSIKKLYRFGVKNVKHILYN